MGCGRCGRTDCQCKMMCDVLIIGAGVIGSSIARELSKYQVKVKVLEKETDVCQGASKANSGIVHGGYDAKHGTVKSKLSRRGNRMFQALDNQLNFGFKQVGSMVLAFTDAEVSKLEELKENGELNGVDDLQIIDGDKVREMEPHVSVGVKAALYCPTAGIVSPYEYCFSLVENAVQNGVDFHVGEQVSGIDVVESLQTREREFRVYTLSGNMYLAKCVVNCAGLHADEISKMVNAGLKYSIQARKGEYVVLEKSQGDMARTVIFQTPTARWGKGILVSPTARGNLLIGPSAAEQDNKTNKDTSIHELAYVAWAARRSVPHLDTRKALTSFSGLRARSSIHDFIIDEDPKVRGFVHVAGIESPGLTSSPAIAVQVVDLLRNACGLKLVQDPTFDPSRRHPVDFSKPPLAENVTLKDVESMTGPAEVICLCENVTRGEIEQALDQAGVPIKATDSVKWRTRAGMGWCQGARCRARVAEIVAEKLADGSTMQTIPKKVHSNPETDRVTRERLARL